MALIVEKSLTRIILSWTPDGETFRGGDYSEVTRVIDDATGEEVARSERVAIPIAGSDQAGVALSQVLGDTEAQRTRSLAKERDRADKAEARVQELMDEIEAQRTRD